jgi:hypothetical protein
MKIGKGKPLISAIDSLTKGGQQQGGQQRQGQGRSVEDIRLQKMRHDRMMDTFERPKSAVDCLKTGGAKILQETKSKAKPGGALGKLYKAAGKLL